METKPPPGDEPIGRFLVIVYPQDTEAPALGALAARLISALRDACGETPTMVRPNMTTLCLLVRGKFTAISRAVEDVTDAYSHWLVVSVGTPHAAHGLSTADQWFRRR